MNKRSAIAVIVALTVVSGGLLAWRFGYVPEIGRFFAAEPAGPFGYIEGVSGGLVAGWALDPDQRDIPVTVELYLDGPVGSGTILESSPTDISRPAVNEAHGASGNHGFEFAIPTNLLKPGIPQTVHAYAIDLDTGTRHQLWLFEAAPSSDKPLVAPATFTSSPLGQSTVSGDATISANGITIRTTSRLAGAIDSLTWKGKEFVDNRDHGREIQVAWQGNDQGECFNPTEGGSLADGVGPLTTSFLLELKKTSNTLTTKVHPAFWMTPGTQGIYCDYDITSTGPRQPFQDAIAANRTLVSKSTIEKSLTIGYAGMPQVVGFDTTITLDASELAANPLRYLIIENPAVFMPSEFSVAHKYNPNNQNLLPLAYSGAYSALPYIVSTPDGSHALAVYTDEIPRDAFPEHRQKAFLGYTVNDLRSQFDLIYASTRMPKYPPTGSTFSGGSYRYRSFLVVGTRTEVQQSLNELFRMHPAPGYASPAPVPRCTPAVCANPPEGCSYQGGDICNCGSLVCASASVPPPVSPTATSSARKPGDTDADGDVDIFDYNSVVSAFGRTGSNLGGDVDRDGDVDIFDYNAVVSNFGR